MSNSCVERQTDPCGIQLFHLLSHTGGTGGATLLVDGFYVASILKELHSDVYDMLAQVRVPAHAAGEPGELYRPSPLSGYPVLGRDMNGALIQVRWNNDDRSVMRNLDATQVEAWCVCVYLRGRNGALTRAHMQVRGDPALAEAPHERGLGVLGSAHARHRRRCVPSHLLLISITC